MNDRRNLLIPLLFTGAAFLGALLLFWSQPLTGRILLPLLGGAPSVWNLCLLFFQATLLLGYLYAHFGSSWLGVKMRTL
jgi:hypothetical protein